MVLLLQHHIGLASIHQLVRSHIFGPTLEFIIPNLVTELSKAYTSLKIMEVQSCAVRPEREATITLDLAPYQHAAQLVNCNPALKENFDLRLGDLHMLMAHLRGRGIYINRSGIGSIWMESGLCEQTTTRSI